jgi:hypothetical protein
VGMNSEQRRAQEWRKKQTELGRKPVQVYLTDDEQYFLQMLSKGKNLNDGLWQLIQLARVNSK